MNNVRDFGAVGDGIVKDTAAIQRAIDAGGMVFFPPGVYLSGTLYLRSRGGLELAPGAVLLASPDRNDYNADDFCVQNSNCPSEKASGAHFIVALEQRDIVIRGGGTIDGNRQAFYNEPREDRPGKFKLNDWRPGQMVYFCECEDIRITDVQLDNAPYWTCFLHGCERANIRGVRIRNDYRTPNGDGIDLDCCRFVTVSDCIIHSGDDCITLRGDERKLKKKRPCEYVTIANCILGTPCNAIRVGVGNGIVRDATVSNIVMRDTRTGINICSRYSPSSEGVTIENILFDDIVMEVKRPVALCSDVRGPHDEAVKPIRGIRFRNLSGRAEWSSFVEGNRRGDLADVTFDGVNLRYTGGDMVKEGPGLIYAEFGAKCAPAAFHLANAEAMRFRDVRIVWDTDSPNWKYGVMAENTEIAEINSGCDFGKPVRQTNGR